MAGCHQTPSTALTVVVSLTDLAGFESAGDRLLAWLLALAEAKRRKVHGNPKLFANYHAIAGQARSVVAQHVAGLQDQLAGIVRDGIVHGEATSPWPPWPAPAWPASWATGSP